MLVSSCRSGAQSSAMSRHAGTVYAVLGAENSWEALAHLHTARSVDRSDGNASHRKCASPDRHGKADQEADNGGR